ncbi:MAG: DNA phosphorothioation-associated protein 4 [Candidatus Nanopelagicales bacterium]
MDEIGTFGVRRPADKEELLQRLVDRESGAFPTMRDALVFAAALGWRRQMRIPFRESAGTIEYATLINRFGTEDLLMVMSFAETGDAQVLGANRLADRITIFEEFANGGLQKLDVLPDGAPGNLSGLLEAVDG